MEHSRLQNSIYSRSKATKKFVDGNGILYEQGPEEDMSKFHVMSEAALRKEQLEVYDLQQRMLERQAAVKKLYQGKRGTTEGRMTKNKKESEGFETALKTGKLQDGVQDTETLRTILENSDEVLDDVILPTYDRNATHPGSWSQSYRKGIEVFEPENAVNYTMETIKGKFHQNLDIIEQLFQEKKQLQEKIRELEEEVVEARTASHGGIIYRKPYKRGDDGDTPSSPRAYNASSPRYSPRYSPRSSGRPSTAPNRANKKSRESRHHRGSIEEEIEQREQEQRFISAERMAHLFGEKESKKALEEDGKFIPTQVDATISKSLLASTDKFMQRRRITEWQEQEAKRAQEKYEKELAARYAKASQGPPAPFVGVEQRDALYKQKAATKMDALTKAREEEYSEKRREFQQKLSDHVKKGFHVSEQSYEDIQEQEDEARRVRIEKRKTEQLFNSKAPVDLDLKAASTREEKYRHYYTQPQPFSAPDPSAVREKLEYAALRWTAYLETTKEKMREKEKKERELYNTGADGTNPAERMEARAALVQAKRERRLADQERRREQREADLIRNQRAEMEGVMNNHSTMGGRRLTKAVEERTRMNREKVERQRLVEKRAEEEKKRQKEATAPDRMELQKLVAEREDLRKARAGMSLETPEERAATAAAKGREEYKERRKANQQRISAAVRQRPSLLERHSREMERQAAADRALGIVGDAMVAKGETYPSRDADDKVRARGSPPSYRESKGEGKSDDPYYDDDFVDVDYDKEESKSKEREDRDRDRDRDHRPVERGRERERERGTIEETSWAPQSSGERG